ncbi:hypothetical protein [Bacillus nitratireducens]|uniref:hypothetical protein n=1 Tax=Bacillus nitratireducens TaxID=2026193 RepID=UPI0033978741
MESYKKVVMENTYRAEIQLKRDENKLLSSWQISAFIECLSRSYYKNELLNTIESFIRKGGDVENIFIMDESFKLNKKFKGLNTLNLRNKVDAKTLFHIGKPIGMFPNERIIKISFLFEIFKKMNETLGSFKIAGLSKDYLSELIYYAVNNKFTIEAIKVKVLDLVKIGINEQIQKDKKNIKMDQKKLEDVLEDSLSYPFSKYLKIESDFVNISIVKVDILNNNINNMDKIPSELLSYFNKFKLVFDKLVRPVVGIYNPDNDIVEILCSDFIDKTSYDEQNKRFLDIRSVSRNSPLSVCAILGVGGLTLLSKYITVKLDEKLLCENKESKVTEDKEIEKLMNEINSAIMDKENNIDQNIANVSQELLDKLSEANEKKFVDMAKGYGFLNENAVLKLKKEDAI